MPSELSAASRSALSALRRNLARAKADALLVTDMHNVRYLSGFTGSDAQLLIGKSSQFLLTDSRYVTQAAAQAPGFKIEKIVAKVSDAAAFIQKRQVGVLCFEPGGMTHAVYRSYKKELPGVKLKEAGPWIAGLRKIKRPSEIEEMRIAAEIASQAFRDVIGRFRPGLKETEVALMLETRMRELGSGPAPFETIVASGPRGAFPHGVASEKKLMRKELVTIDYGSIHNGYQSDQTVTFCIGRPDQRQRRIYETVRRAQSEALEAVKAGVSAREVDQKARKVIEKAGYGKYFGHGLGHGVGLETHEAPSLNPRSTDELEEGMVVTVEPGIYIPGYGGVRIEDMAVVMKNHARVLSSSSGPLIDL